MADAKISELAAVTDVQDTDEYVVARSGATKKIAGSDLKAALEALATDWLTGTGAPSDANGNDGDFYLDGSTGDFYEKTAGSWVLSGNLQGPQGDPGAAGATAGTYLVNGATVAWVSGYTYRLSAATYYVDGALVSSAEQNVTLDPADATHDRIDVLVLDGSGAATKITGTASSSPAEPSVDPSQYLRIGLVYVTAASSAASVTETTLYKEGSAGEWTGSPSGASIVVGSTSNPRSGTKDIEGTNVAAGAYVDLAKPSGTIDLATQDKLILYVRAKSAWPTKKSLRFSWRASGATKGATYTVGNGTLGFNSATTGAYQQIAIPLASFSVPAGAGVDTLRIEVVGSGSSIGFYLDDIVLQAGVQQAATAQNWRWRGEWASSVAYDVNDVVSRSGSSYAAIAQSTNADPASSAASWALVAQKGDKGDTGDPGATVASGVSITDAGGYFTGTDVEAALQEIGAGGGGGGGGGGLATFDTPPVASADANSAEFDSGTSLPSGWNITVASGSLTNALLSHPHDTSPANPTYNVNQDVPGALVMQPQAAGGMKLWRAWAPGTGRWAAVVKVHLGNAWDQDDRIHFGVSKITSGSPDAQDEVDNSVWSENRVSTGGISYPQQSIAYYYKNNGFLTGRQAENQLTRPSPPLYLKLEARSDNSIRNYWSYDGINWVWGGMNRNSDQVVGNVTHIWLTIGDAGSNPSAFVVVEFFRLYDNDNNTFKMGFGS